MIYTGKVLGIIFPNMHDEAIPQLTQLRTMASVPFAGRYRMIDFTLSAFVAAGVSNVCVIPRTSYVSLMDHIGSGKEWDLARKIGGLKIFPPYSEAGTHRYNGKIEAMSHVKKYIEAVQCETVILADCGIASAIDYSQVLKQHAETNADITVIYHKEKLNKDAKNDNVTFEIMGSNVTGVFINDVTQEECNASMWSYVLSKKLLLEIIDECMSRGLTHFERDVLQQSLSYMQVYAYEYTGYMQRINSLQSYFNANLDIINRDNMNALFRKFPIYTKIRDDAPVRYAIGSNAKKLVAGDGCYIEGNVENSVLFRGVKIGKGATVKNCVIFQDCVIESGACLENVICDKGVVVTKDQRLIGAQNHPVFVEKKAVI